MSGDASELPPDLRALIELLAERMGAGAGMWHLRFRVDSGHLRKWWLETEGGAPDLDRLSELPPSLPPGRSGDAAGSESPAED